MGFGTIFLWKLENDKFNFTGNKTMKRKIKEVPDKENLIEVIEEIWDNLNFINTPEHLYEKLVFETLKKWMKENGYWKNNWMTEKRKEEKKKYYEEHKEELKQKYRERKEREENLMLKEYIIR